MAITFTQQKKKQQTMVLVAVFLVLATVAVLRWNAIKKAPEPEEALVVLPSELEDIEINFGIFAEKDFQRLQEPQAKPILEVGNVGRENPFEPY